MGMDIFWMFLLLVRNMMTMFPKTNIPAQDFLALLKCDS